MAPKELFCGAIYYLIIVSAVVLFAGCASVAPPADPTRSFALLDARASVYMGIPADQNQELISVLAKTVGLTDDISLVIDRTERIYVSLSPVTGQGTDAAPKRFCVILEGAYPQRIVRSQLVKNGWQKHDVPGGIFYSAGQMLVSLPQSGMIVIFSGYTATDMEYFLSGGESANGGRYMLGGTALPAYLDPAFSCGSAVVWIPQPQRFLQKLVKTDAVTIPAESVAAFFEPSVQDTRSYTLTFFIQPKQKLMEKALYAMVKYAASGCTVTLQNGLVCVSVENAAVDMLLQNFMGE